jgi:hypothetical protein
MSGLGKAPCGQDLIMLTALIVLMSVIAILAAGEVVRVQCRRMLVRPLALHFGAHDGIPAEAAA